MKNRHIVYVILICSLASMVLWGCNKNSVEDNAAKDPKAQITLEEMKDKMLESQEMPMMFETEASLYETAYEKSVDKLSDSLFYEAVSVSSARIFIAEVTEATDVEEIKADFEDCAVRVQNIFEEYLPDAYEMSKNAKVVTKGRYVLLVIAPDPELCVQVFEDNII